MVSFFSIYVICVSYLSEMVSGYIFVHGRLEVLYCNQYKVYQHEKVIVLMTFTTQVRKISKKV